METETKYKFVETTGCTAFSFTVNDKALSGISEQEQEEILNYLFEKVKESVKKSTIQFEDVVKLFQYDDYEHDPDICETSGDSRSSMTWNI